MATVALSGIITPTNVVTATSTTTLTNKTLTAPTIASANLTTALTLAGVAGTNGQVLTSAGSGLPSWTTISASQWTTTGSDIYYNTGNVGIGTATPSALLELSKTSSDVGFYMTRLSSGAASYRQSINGDGDIKFAMVSNKNIFFDTNNTTRMSIPATGGIQSVTTISVGNATPSASGAGITFPATQSASTDAHTLDDYEEGTWTPNVGGTSTYSYQLGKYTKIGNLVTIMADMTILLLGTGSTTDVGSAPFGPSGDPHSGCVGYYSNTAVNVLGISCYITATTPIVKITGSTTAGTTTTNGIAVFGNSARVAFTISYSI